MDTYGGIARHGGGAFSGKDPTKVDRSAAYMARYAAKNIVAAGLCHRCGMKPSYAIGVPQPVSVKVDTFHTEEIPYKVIEQIVKRDFFDFSVAGIISKLSQLNFLMDHCPHTVTLAGQICSFHGKRQTKSHSCSRKQQKLWRKILRD